MVNNYLEVKIIMNFYNEIKRELIDNEVYKKDYSK